MATPAQGMRTRTTQATIQWASENLDLSYEQIGGALGAHRRTIHRWRSADSLPSPRHQARVEKLQQIRFLLYSVFRDDEATMGWLHSPAPAFRGRTPLALVKEGRLDEVIEALATLETGAAV